MNNIYSVLKGTQRLDMMFGGGGGEEEEERVNRKRV